MKKRAPAAHIDFETFSRLKSVTDYGAKRYAEDESTEIISLAWAIGKHERPTLWLPGDREPRRLRNHIRNGGTVHAWNCEFEMPIHEILCVGELGWEPIPFLQWRDTAAIALALGFPAKLEKAAPALGIEDLKDKRGKHLIQKLCKGRKPSKNNPDDRWTPETAPQDFADFYEYNVQDVVTERAMYWGLPTQRLMHGEINVWRQTMEMNSRGLPMDLDSVEQIIMLLAEHREKTLRELVELTDGAIKTDGQRDKILAWMDEHGTVLPNYQKKTLEDVLAESKKKRGRVRMDKKVKRLIEIRLELSKISNKKYGSIIDRICEDGTVKDNLLYHGASTGRYAGRGFQAQNIPADSISDSQRGVERALEVLAVDKPIEAVEMMYGPFPHYASALIRSMICAPEGEILYGADFSSVENRVTVWYADDDYGIQLFNDGLDQYKVWCSERFQVPYDQVTDKQRKLGKQVILGCCFGMGWKTLITTCAKHGIFISAKHAKRSVKDYREQYFEVVEMWEGLCNAAKYAVKDPERTYRYNNLACRVEGEFLYIKLASGRMLAYHKPEMRMEKAPWGQYIPTVTHMGTNTYTKKWERLSASPGRLTENVVQATARDIMVDRAFDVERAGYPIILSVHDELISQTPEGFGSKREYVSIMDDQPNWIMGIPITTEGWTGRRFRK